METSHKDIRLAHDITIDCRTIYVLYTMVLHSPKPPKIFALIEYSFKYQTFFSFFYAYTSQAEAINSSLLLGLDSHVRHTQTLNKEQNPVWDFKANEAGAISSHIV